MSKREFRVRLSASYEDPDNAIAELAVGCEDEGTWREFVPGLAEPGFLIFVYAILNCQHQLLRLGAAERGLALEEAEGLVEVETDAAWRMHKLHIRFEGRLRSGRASARDVDGIVERMRHCPVSVNLADVPDTEITLRLD